MNVKLKPVNIKSYIIALGESWAYHMGHFLSDRKYGASSSALFEQGQNYNNGSPLPGLSSHLNLLEDFSSQRTNDPFFCIPQGLFYDLIDNRNDRAATGNVILPNDNAINYTNQQFYNALESDIKSLPSYRIRLLNQNTNNQAGVTPLFTYYNY